MSPKDSERFFLKLILNRVKGATSFIDLHTHNNITYETYKETAISMGLIQDDSQIFNIFEEACRIMLPFQLRKFFAWFVLAENYQGKNISDKFKSYFCEDFQENKENQALNHINDILSLEDMSCKTLGLPEPIPLNKVNIFCNKDDILNSSKIFDKMFKQLNNDQKIIFEQIFNNTNKIIFIDGPGGSGKTFLYKTIIYYFISKNKNILSMAWTGIASILLPKGMTAHRTFRLPLDLSNIESSFLKLDSDKKKLREVEVIIWDEASMIPKKALEIIDKTLKDVCMNELPFAGKLIILGEDFRQILPVMKNGFRSMIVEETIKYSNLWSYFKIFKLHKNV